MGLQNSHKNTNLAISSRGICERTYVFEGIHGGSWSFVDAVVLIGLGFAPSVENDQSDGFSFWELGVVLEFPVNVAGATHSWIQIYSMVRNRKIK